MTDLILILFTAFCIYAMVDFIAGAFKNTKS